MNMKEQLEMQAAYSRGDFKQEPPEPKRRGRPPKPKPENDE